MKKDPVSQVLRIGATLERGDLAKIYVRTPRGELSYFRCNGVQVIPTEAEEIDTGGSCTLVISPLAAVLSGVLIRCLRILGHRQPRHKIKGVIKEMVECLISNRTKPAGSWENGAAKALITIALKWAEKSLKEERSKADQVSYEPTMENLADGWSLEEMSHMIEMRHRRVGRAIRVREESDRLLEFTLGEVPEDPKRLQGWLVIAGIQGWVVGQTWMPVLGPEDRLDEKVIRKVAKGLARRGLKGELAMAVLTNTRSRDERNKKQ
jgi:hypothetical protein